MDNLSHPLKGISRLALFATSLALIVIIIGAYTRLKDAGLGCPDWPGCYGQLVAPSSPTDIAQANAAYPEIPVEISKARTEMTHRYFAETLGAFIMLIGVMTFIQRKKNPAPVWLAGLLMVLVIFQGMLGMWTVTLRLLPLTVMGHLMGGFCTLALLWLFFLKSRFSSIAKVNNGSLRRLCFITMLTLIVQIFLGGWTSANYAALVCPDFPLCQGQWWPQTNFPNAFNLLGGLGMDNPLLFMNGIERTTIHITHRIGAAVVLMLGLYLVLRLLRARTPILKRFALSIGAVLTLQVLLGLANVLMHLPLAIAVAHNAVAALLLLSLVTLLFYLSPPKVKILCHTS